MADIVAGGQKFGNAAPLSAQQLVEAAEREIKTLSVDEAIALHGTDNVQFIDVRDVRELQREGKIPGAYHAPRGMLEFWIDPQSEYAKSVFQQPKTYIFFCAAGWRSALATKTAQDMGLSPVCHIEGGFSAWKQSGGTIELLAPKPQGTSS